MKNRLVVLFFLFALVISSAAEYKPLSEKWSAQIRSDEAYLIDLDKDGLLEVYSISYGQHSSCIRAVSYEGEVKWAECFSGFSRLYYPSASEEYSFIYLDDLWHDAILDVLAGSSIRGGSVNVQKFYFIQRQQVRGTARFEYELLWDYKPQNVVTDIEVADAFNGSTISDFVFSSIDSNVYVIAQNTTAKGKIGFPDAVWSIDAADVDGDSFDELAVGALSGVYLVDCSPGGKVSASCGVVWNHPTSSRISEVEVADFGGGERGVIAASENVVYALDPAGVLRWSVELADVRDILVKDVDNDGGVEVLVVTDGSVVAFDKAGVIRWTQVFDDRLLSITTDVYNNIFLGSENRLYYLVASQDYMLDKQGWGTYELAYGQYLQRQYSEARYNAARARRMFEMVGDLEGVAKCDFLLVVTDPASVAEDIKFKADAYYKQAEELFAAGLFTEASYNASTALSIYLEVGERDNAIKCDMLLFQINKAQNEQKRNRAEADYAAASDSFSKLLFSNAVARAEAAVDGFDYLNDSVRLEEARTLLSKINAAEKMSRADAAYSKAAESMASGDYGAAAASAEEARGLYAEVGDMDKVKACDSFLASAEKYAEAASYYALAVSEFESSRLDNASVMVGKAKAVYLGLNDAKKAAECDSLQSKIEGAKFGGLINYAIVAVVAVVLIALFLAWKKKKAS